jgi:hypothetical protein
MFQETAAYSMPQEKSRIERKSHSTGDRKESKMSDGMQDDYIIMVATFKFEHENQWILRKFTSEVLPMTTPCRLSTPHLTTSMVLADQLRHRSPLTTLRSRYGRARKRDDPRFRSNPTGTNTIPGEIQFPVI